MFIVQFITNFTITENFVFRSGDFLKNVFSECRKCYFRDPNLKNFRPKTKLEFEKAHTSGDNEHYRAKIVTKRNDSRLNNHQQLHHQGWRANCDIQVVIDHALCLC
jgi:acid stress-induced BolA-like protein IbaG/YrbA